MEKSRMKESNKILDEMFKQRMYHYIKKENCYRKIVEYDITQAMVMEMCHLKYKDLMKYFDLRIK